MHMHIATALPVVSLREAKEGFEPIFAILIVSVATITAGTVIAYKEGSQR
jgi:hypothetical protein